MAAMKPHGVSRPEPYVATYTKLRDGLLDMIESGRLTEADIPDDAQWLIETLAALANDDTLERGIQAARRVVSRWCEGDLAEAVNQLEAWVASANGQTTTPVNFDALAAQVRADDKQEG